jgi:hypothetical protein
MRACQNGIQEKNAPSHGKEDDERNQTEEEEEETTKQPHVHQPWTTAEDLKLQQMQEKYGNKWATVAASLPGRTGQQCAQRWRHRVNPNIRREKWTKEEDEKVRERLLRATAKCDLFLLLYISLSLLLHKTRVVSGFSMRTRKKRPRTRERSESTTSPNAPRFVTFFLSVFFFLLSCSLSPSFFEKTRDSYSSRLGGRVSDVGFLKKKKKKKTSRTLGRSFGVCFVLFCLFCVGALSAAFTFSRARVWSLRVVRR